MIFIESKNFNPSFNLALEQFVFDEMPKNEHYFILWQNDNTIVVGLNQNTVEEINPEYVEDNDIQVVRRLSGGGAVYHDLGNLNFTFISDVENLELMNMKIFCDPIIKTLSKLGIQAKITGRNDITIDGKKFSGNSQYIKKGRIMHHGTILFDSNLQVISQALSFSKDKIESKGLKSKKSSVTNIRENLQKDITIDEFKEVLISNIFIESEVSKYELTANDIAKVNAIKEGRYDTWEWNYGASPKYNIMKTRRVENCGKIEIYMNIEQGMIETIRIMGDFFGKHDISELENYLCGLQNEKNCISDKLKTINLENYICNLEADELVKMLTL